MMVIVINNNNNNDLVTQGKVRYLNELWNFLRYGQLDQNVCGMCITLGKTNLMR